jgi:hypothetical protein
MMANVDSALKCDERTRLEAAVMETTLNMHRSENAGSTLPSIPIGVARIAQRKAVRELQDHCIQHGCTFEMIRSLTGERPCLESN